MGARTITTYSQPTVYGTTFRTSKRTAAHLDWTKERLAVKAKRDGKAYKLSIIQGSYNTGVAASAGTHDKDAVLDVKIEGLDWWDAQAFLRDHGWAAWYRYPPLFGEHIHMISLGYVNPVGVYVPGQVYDYYHDRNGLASHSADTSYHPADIDATIFDYGKRLSELRARKTLDNTRRRKRHLLRQLAKRIRDLISKVKGNKQ